MAGLLSKELVDECRRSMSTADFGVKFVAFCQSSQFHTVEERMQLEEFGGVQLALDYIRSEPDDAHLLGRAWVLMQNFVLVSNVDNPLELKPIEIFVERGGIELAVAEMTRAEPRWGQVILTTLAWTSTNEKVVPRIVASGVHKVGIKFVREANAQFLDISMSFIRSVSAAASCRSTLRADGALEAFLPFVNCNKSTEQYLMRRGFRATSIVARLAGSDETGIGPQFLHNNPEVIRTTLKIFNDVLEAGPNGTVINMLVNPHFITMDLLTISIADVNKPLLIDAIPICFNALRLRGLANVAMVSDIIQIFLQLSFNPSCKAKLKEFATEICALLTQMVRPFGRDKVTPGFTDQDCLAVDMLQETLTETSRPSGSAKETRSIPHILTQHNPKKWIFLSYFWPDMNVVQQVDRALLDYGFNVWVDYRCVVGDVTQSVNTALDNSIAVVVFASSKFKENALCRREVDAAGERKLPIIFVTAEPSFKPAGWISFLISTRPALQMSDEKCISYNLPLLIDKLLIADPKQLALDNQCGSRQPSSNQMDQFVHAIATLTKTVNDLKSEMATLKCELAELKKSQS